MKNNKAILNVDFKKDGWFSKFYKFSTNLSKYENITQNGCRIAWTTLFAIILLPLTWWNVPYNLLQTDIYERPPNLIAKALLGLLFYVIYFLFIAAGFGFFVSGVDSEGEVMGYLINLVHMDNVTPLWLFLLLPVLGILTIGIILGSIIGVIVLIATIREYILEYFEDIRLKKLKRELSSNELNDGGIGKERKRSTFTNFMILLMNLKDKYCPVVNWK